MAAVLITAITCSAQDLPAVSKGNLQFYADYAAFMGKENKTYTEFYLMLFSDQLINEANSADTIQEFAVRSKISNPADAKIIDDKKWFTNALLPRDSTKPNNAVVYDQWAELLNPGTYKVTITVSANGVDKEGEAELMLTVPEFESSTFSLSQIEFVSEVQNKIDGSPFIKGDKKIIPNPWRRYGALNSRLSFFYEIYNMPSGSDLRGEYAITDNKGRTVKKLSDIEYSNSSGNVSIVHGINISNLPTGTYNLNIELADSASSSSTSQSRTFEVIQMDTSSQHKGLTEEDAEIGGGLIQYLGTPAQHSFYEDLDQAGKAQYIIDFWAQNDPTPGTPENEFLQKIMERFHYANKNFKWQNIPGWKTDRGRIIIKYGMPDDIEYHNTEADMKNYEIWTYNQDKQFNFVFADIRSNGNFKLINSTKEGEVSDPNWRDYLR